MSSTSIVAVAVLPAVSVATAETSYHAAARLAKLKVVVYGALVIATPAFSWSLYPRSTTNCTLATPPTPPEAVAVSVVTPETVALFAGAVMDTVIGLAAVTVSAAVFDVIDPLLAVMLVVPAAFPVATPVDAIVATVVLDEVHVTELVMFWVGPLE